MRSAWKAVRKQWPKLAALSLIGVGTGAGLAVLASAALYPYDAFAFSLAIFLGISLARALVLKSISGARGPWPVVRRVGIDLIIALLAGVYIYLAPFLANIAEHVGSGDLFIMAEIYGWAAAAAAAYLLVAWFWAGAECMTRPVWEAVGRGYGRLLSNFKESLRTLATYTLIYSPYFALNLAASNAPSWAGAISLVNAVLLVGILIPLGEAYYFCAWKEKK